MKKTRERKRFRHLEKYPSWLKGLPWKGSRSLVAARGFKSLFLRFLFAEKQLEKKLKKLLTKLEGFGIIYKLSLRTGGNEMNLDNWTVLWRSSKILWKIIQERVTKKVTRPKTVTDRTSWRDFWTDLTYRNVCSKGSRKSRFSVAECLASAMPRSPLKGPAEVTA